MSAIQKVSLQPAYILSAKPFRETSLLLQVFSRDYGRVSLIAKGGRSLHSGGSNKKRKSRPRFQGLLQPFVPLLMSWQGRTDLFNLVQVEVDGLSCMVEGKALLGGWYMNELLLRTLRDWEAYLPLFEAYDEVLKALNQSLASNLRRFEKSLLTALGVMPSFQQETNTGLLIDPKKWYTFSAEYGITASPLEEAQGTSHFSGGLLLAIERNQWAVPDYTMPMKRLFRLMLDHVLGGQVLRTRELLYSSLK